MIRRKEHMILNGASSPFRILHISDIHFSVHTSHEQNQSLISDILRKTDFYSASTKFPKVIAVTGDLVSRRLNDSSIPDALNLLVRLKQIAPVVYSLGNHEKDLPAPVLADMLKQCRKANILILDNSSVLLHDVTFTGLTLPQSVFKNIDGNYFSLEKITTKMILSCVGTCPAHPCILLAHSPFGLEAYARWGADIVLSGHIHGGIVRVPVLGGILSPERKFFPKYTKGIYQSGGCTMNVSAGIGKFRMNNPAEFVCIDIFPRNYKLMRKS